MAKSPIERILAPVNLSSCSRAALEFACALAAANGAKVETLLVQPRGSDGAAAAVRQELHRFIAGIAGATEVVSAELLEEGDPRERIVAVSEKGFDAIVLGTHGRTGRARSLAGSVAEAVVRTASCPVITVREK